MRCRQRAAQLPVPHAGRPAGDRAGGAGPVAAARDGRLPPAALVRFRAAGRRPAAVPDRRAAGVVGHPHQAGAGRRQSADLPGQAPAQHRPRRSAAVLRGEGGLAGAAADRPASLRGQHPGPARGVRDRFDHQRSPCLDRDRRRLRDPARRIRQAGSDRRAGGAVRPAGRPASTRRLAQRSRARAGPGIAGPAAGADHAATGPGLGPGAHRREFRCARRSRRPGALAGRAAAGGSAGRGAGDQGRRAGRVPAGQVRRVHSPGPGPAGRGVQHQPGAHRNRTRRVVRSGAVPRRADPRRLRSRAADRLRLLGSR
jgi:hypothetical protein